MTLTPQSHKPQYISVVFCEMDKVECNCEMKRK